MNKHIIILATTCIAFIASCSTPARKPAEKATQQAEKIADSTIQLTEQQIKNAGITLGTVEQREMHTNLRVTGMVDVPPQNIISISIPLGGYLKKTSLLPGLKVAKGAVLATLEDQQYIQLQQDYLTTKSKLVYYEAEYNRQKKLNETKAASDKVYQQALSDFDGQRILLKSLGEKLMLIGINPQKLSESTISRSISIYAPISGYVTKVNVNIGKYVNPTDVLFELVNPDDLHLSLSVFENDATNIVMGQKVLCYTNNHPDVKYEAEVHLINPSIGKDRATEVHCHFEKANKELMPGMFMNAEIEMGNAKMNCLPEDAVVKWNNENFIFCEAGPNKFTMQKVETGHTDKGYVAIKSTLPDARIVTKNAYSILMKLKNNAEE